MINDQGMNRCAMLFKRSLVPRDDGVPSLTKEGIPIKGAAHFIIGHSVLDIGY